MNNHHPFTNMKVFIGFLRFGFCVWGGFEGLPTNKF